MLAFSKSPGLSPSSLSLHWRKRGVFSLDEVTEHKCLTLSSLSGYCLETVNILCFFKPEVLRGSDPRGKIYLPALPGTC